MILKQEINSENFLKTVHSNGRLLQKPCFKLQTKKLSSELFDPEVDSS
jgi:hypothetical protein